MSVKKKSLPPQRKTPETGARSEKIEAEPSAAEARVFAPVPGFKPEILAPAGDMPAALAAFAAGADAVYLGLKHFSARMQAENFSTAELARLTDFAREEGRRVYVAMNTMVKPSEPAQAFRLIKRLALDVRPNALIVQDPGMPALAREAGFEGEIHLSTLANITHQKALAAAKELGASRVIVPRELSVDEVRLMNDACPEDMALEIFVHGALCFCVSGRCWWSSALGGKSGLRGRCVQPCRRVYKQKGREGRAFSCLDLSLDILARSLLSMPRVTSWKIEGRRKGPHYVYYATSAYRMLRDFPEDSQARKEAVGILEMALGRGRTRSLFLPQKPQAPTRTEGRDETGQTGSGLLCGKMGKGSGGKYEFRPRLPLLPKDYLRVGFEDEPWHAMVSVPKWVPEGAAFTLVLPRGKNPKPGTPVFLIDRKEPELTALINDWGASLDARQVALHSREADIMTQYPTPPKALRMERGTKRLDIALRSSLPQGRDGKGDLRPGRVQGLWLSPRAAQDVSKTLYGRTSWWLPPVIWPDEEEMWAKLVFRTVRGGGRHFVLNAPWQTALFENKADLALTAGPFCNIANAYSIEALRGLGFSAAIITPELSGEDILSLPGQSSLPLGIVLSGWWPMGVSRHSPEFLKPQEAFLSPKNEEFWTRRYGQNVWIYSGRPLDLSARRQALEKAGFLTFVHMEEHPPKGLTSSERTTELNWDVDLL